jgi:hypothetical protein
MDSVHIRSVTARVRFTALDLTVNMLTDLSWCRACHACWMLFLHRLQFFFIKQRTVRPMSQPGKLEQLVLILTLGIVLVACFSAVVAQGDIGRLDGTCQLFQPMYLLIAMAIVDMVLSSLYLCLIIGPLRETIRLAEAARVFEACAAATGVIPTAAGADKSVLNVSLEPIMRKIKRACVVAGQYNTQQ